MALKVRDTFIYVIGKMSGLAGQAAYGEVDMVMSGVMTTRDR